MRRFILITILSASAASAGAAVLREASGLVQVRVEGSESWRPAGRPPRTLKAGDAVRTGFNARAAIELDGGAVVEAAGNTQLSLDEAARGGAVVNLLFGSARIGGRFLGGRALELRTPTATARARSEAAAWRGTVGGGGSSVFEVAHGLVAVEDSRGGDLLLRDGERVEADLAGLHEPTAAPTPARARREDFAERMRRELALDQEPDAAQRLVSDEVRAEEFQLGHVLTDASGDLVRAEQFLVRPTASSFGFVSLTEARGAGLSWSSWTGTFSSALPRNLSPVIAILPGSVGAPAPWTLTSFTSTVSNGVDSLTASGINGHQVDLNDNGNPLDAVATLYNPANDSYANVAGRPVFKVLFDDAGLYSDGVLKSGWTGSNIQSPSQEIPATTNDPLTGAALASPLPVFTTNTTFPDAGALRQVVFTSYSDGTSITVDDQSVAPAPGGGVAPGGADSGPALQAEFLRSTFEQTTTASEFGGRSIDVLVAPRILIETGGLP